MHSGTGGEGCFPSKWNVSIPKQRECFEANKFITLIVVMTCECIHIKSYQIVYVMCEIYLKIRLPGWLRW